MNDGPGAHRAGLLGDVEVAVRQTPVTEGALGLGECQHFRMGGGVFQRLHLIPGASDDLSLVNNDRTDGHLIEPGSLACLTQRLPHKMFIGVQKQRVSVKHGAMVG